MQWTEENLFHTTLLLNLTDCRWGGGRQSLTHSFDYSVCFNSFSQALEILCFTLQPNCIFFSTRTQAWKFPFFREIIAEHAEEYSVEGTHYGTKFYILKLMSWIDYTMVKDFNNFLMQYSILSRTIPSRAERVPLYVTVVCVLRLYVHLSVYQASATHLSNLSAWLCL